MLMKHWTRKIASFAANGISRCAISLFIYKYTVSDIYRRLP